MPKEQPKLRRGRIIFATIYDHNGFAKNRPCLVLTKTEDIHPDEPLVVMAITTSFIEPPPGNCITLPWHPRGHPITRLRQRSAAVVGWYDEITVSDVLGYGGDVPPKTMSDILARVKLDSGPERD